MIPAGCVSMRAVLKLSEYCQRTCIVDQDVKSIRLRGESFGGILNRGEGGQVQRQVLDV